MRSPTKFMVICGLITFGFSLTLGAAADQSNTVPIRDLTGMPADSYRPLSLNEAIAYGVQNNLDVEVNRYSPYASELESEASWGAYDPVFSGKLGYVGLAEENTFTLSDQDVTQRSNLAGDASLSALIPYWGGQVSVTLDSDRGTTNDSLSQYSPVYEAGLEFGAKIPLLRGLIWNEPWTQVKLSRLSYGASVDDFSTSVMDTVLSIIGAYWDLVASREQVRVALKSLESTRALLQQTEIQYQVGVVSRVEVVQAEAGVANSEFNLIVARNDFLNNQDNLIAKVLGNRLRADTTLLFDPTDNPEYTGVEPIDLNAAVATAFANRPELAAAQKQIEQREVQLKFAKNQRLPQFDVDFRYRTMGITGQGNPNIRPFQMTLPEPIGVVDFGSSRECGTDIPCGGYGSAFGEFYDNNHEVRAMGVVSIPLGNTRARKDVSKARIEMRKAKSQVTRLQQVIIKDVRQAARSLLAAAQGVEAAERRRIAAAEQLRAETIRLEHGESTPFDVLQRERDLVDAESQKIDALQAFRISRARLERDEGMILQARNVSIEQVRKLE